MMFKYPSFDYGSRTFKGIIEWTGRYLSGDGSTNWRYEMIFSQDFKSVVDGSIKHMSSKSMIPIRTEQFNKDLFYNIF